MLLKSSIKALTLSFYWISNLIESLQYKINGWGCQLIHQRRSVESSKKRPNAHNIRPCHYHWAEKNVPHSTLVVFVRRMCTEQCNNSSTFQRLLFLSPTQHERLTPPRFLWIILFPKILKSEGKGSNMVSAKCSESRWTSSLGLSCHMLGQRGGEVSLPKLYSDST
jgi:hypothetical protein